jgi:uncharacterized OB-fold protein
MRNSIVLYNSEGKKPYLLGSECKICGYVSFPEKSVCVKCRREDTMKKFEIGKYGNLENFAVMRVGTSDYPAPYVIGYIRSKEGAIIFSQIINCEPKDDSLKIGQEMELVIEKLGDDEEGKEMFCYKYKPIREKV